MFGGEQGPVDRMTEGQTRLKTLPLRLTCGKNAPKKKEEEEMYCSIRPNDS